MRRVLCIFIYLPIVFAMAAQADESLGPPQIHVLPLAPDVDPSSFNGPQYKIETGERISKPVVRNRLIAEAGLNDFVHEWDDVDRDLLILRAREFTQDKLFKRYPKLPPSKLQKLRELASKREKPRP